MSEKFFLASGNVHKAKEFTELFDKKIAEVLPAPEKVDVEESGVTFQQNAFVKAEKYHQKFQVPVLADDSGLEVACLHEEMGVHSARFGGEGLSDRERATLLLEKLKSKVGVDRSACFVCVLCFYFSDQEIFFFEGRMEGKIAFEYRGEAGFGYDPIFIPTHGVEDSTLAEIPDWKKEHSHRSKAVALAHRFFVERAFGRGVPPLNKTVDKLGPFL